MCAGEFLCSFGCDENGVKLLKYPCGMCVCVCVYIAGQYVYVADQIVAFTTEGDYIKSFSSRSYYDICVAQWVCVC